MNLSKKRKGDENAGAMPRVILELLVVALVLLAAFAMFSPTFNKVFLPLSEKFAECWSEKASCLLKAATAG